MTTLNMRITKLSSGSSFIVTLLCALLLSGMSMAQAAEQWVLTDIKVNPNNVPTEYIGGGENPDYYPEARYIGKYEKYTVTDGSFTYRDHSVDHAYLYHDPTFIAKFDKPPARMTAGDSITLNATTEGSGFVSEYSGGWASSIRFSYHADGVTLTGDSYAATGLDFIKDTATVTFNVPAAIVGGQIVINASTTHSACLVQYIYEPDTFEEGFVLTNTGSGEIRVNGVPVPRCSSSLQGFDRNLPVASGGCEIPIEEFDQLLGAKNAKLTLNRHCVMGLVQMIALQYFDGYNEGSIKPSFLLAILVLHDDPSLCANRNSKPYAVASSNRISFDLQSGGARFKPALDNLGLDIETDTVKVSSIAKNDFAVDHNRDTNLTIAACYSGSVTIDPTNPALSSVTLKTGQQVKVTKDGIGPVTRISQTSFLPSLLLLKGDEK